MSQLSDYIQRIKEVQALLSNTPKLVQQVGIVAGKEVEAAMSRRIFLRGQATDGGAIGQYSTTPIYVNPKAPFLLLLPKFQKRKPNLTPIGKNGDKVFKNGKPHKTAYLAGGYKELRQRTGRDAGAKLKKFGGIATSGVNLNLTGSMAQNFTTGINSGVVALGFTVAKEFEKARGNEKRFGKTIFAASPQEVATFSAAVNREMNILIQKIMQP
jgi:hypothetical protein